MKANGTIAADLAKGAVAGAAATWVMDRVDWAMVEHEDPEAWRRTQSVRPNGKDPAHNMVGAMAKAVGLNPPDQPHPAGIAMHYALARVPPRFTEPCATAFQEVSSAAVPCSASACSPSRMS
jgi:hypothetical protein